MFEDSSNENVENINESLKKLPSTELSTNNGSNNEKSIKNIINTKNVNPVKNKRNIKRTSNGLRVATKAAAKGAKVASKGMKATGKGVKAATNAAGTALSAIPVVGGVLGAGVKASGHVANAAAQAGGKATELGGKALDKASDKMKKDSSKLKDASGKVEKRGTNSINSREDLKDDKATKALVKLGKILLSFGLFILFNFPVFFLLFILIGGAIGGDENYDYFAQSELVEFYSDASSGNIAKAVINELSQPVEVADGVTASFSGKYNYGITNGYMHNGIDLNKETIGANPGSPVYSIYKGIVDSVGNDSVDNEPGYWIRIKHEVSFSTNQVSIIYSLYKGLDESSVLLTVGDEVDQKQKLGVIDSNGSLHFEIDDESGKPLNPINVYIPFSNAVIANTVTGNEVIDKIITMITTSNVLDDRMKDNVHIASILGNIQAESGFNVASSQAGVPKEQVNENTPLAIGLVQWDYERKENLIYYSRAEGSTWYDIDIQLRFFEGELTRDNRSSLSDNIQKYTSYQLGNGFDKWLNETNPETAATIYTDSFERCDPEYCHYEKRKFSARCWYNLLQNGQNSADYCMTHES